MTWQKWVSKQALEKRKTSLSLMEVFNISPKNGLDVLCEAWRGVLQNFTINAMDMLVIDCHALHIRKIDAFKSS
jgi:hypothetical protein